MYYSERKEKSGPSKLIKELALFIIIDMDHAALKSGIKNILNVSGRTILRYIEELNNCSIPKIVTNPTSPREYSYEDYDDEAEFNLSMFFSDDQDQHMKKLKRMISIYSLFKYDFIDYMCFIQDPEVYADNYDEPPEKVNVKRLNKRISDELKHESNIPVRTLERDIKDIYESLNLIADNYMLNI